MATKDEWLLMHRDTLIATLKVYDSDQPWYLSHFIPNKNFKDHEYFFSAFQEKYESGKIQNFDKFFAELKVKEYSIKLENETMVEFMLIFDKSKKQVRIRKRESFST